MKFVLPALAALVVASAADAQCPARRGPVRSFFARAHADRHPAAAAVCVRVAVSPAAVPPAPAFVPLAAPPAMPATAGPQVQASGLVRDRLRERMLAEINELKGIDQKAGLTPIQWDRLLALIELFLKLFAGK